MQYMAASAAKYPPPNMPGVPTATGCQQPRQVLDTAGELAAMYLLNAVSDAVQHPTDKSGATFVHSLAPDGRVMFYFILLAATEWLYAQRHWWG